MKDAVIVATARTGIGKAGRGSLNLTHGAAMGGHVARIAVERAGMTGQMAALFARAAISAHCAMSASNGSSSSKSSPSSTMRA